MKIQVQNETLDLLPEKAFFWEKERLLGFSDVHFGKAESFQKMGIPMPSEARLEDFKQIQRLIEKFNPAQIVILGDLIHNKDSWTPELLQDLSSFIGEHAKIRWILILGNHERGSQEFLQQLPFEIFIDSFHFAPFQFTHGHLERWTADFTIEGHVHPAVTLSDGPLRLRFPCFVLEPHRMLIPAFGSLTGGFEIPAQANQRRFAVTPDEVFEIANRPRREPFASEKP